MYKKCRWRRLLWTRVGKGRLLLPHFSVPFPTEEFQATAGCPRFPCTSHRTLGPLPPKTDPSFPLMHKVNKAFNCFKYDLNIKSRLISHNVPGSPNTARTPLSTVWKAAFPKCTYLGNGNPSKTDDFFRKIPFQQSLQIWPEYQICDCLQTSKNGCPRIANCDGGGKRLIKAWYFS